MPRIFPPFSWCQLHSPALWLASTLSLRTYHHPHDPPHNNVSTCSWHSWTAWPMKMGLIGCPKMSVTSCWPMPCNIPQEWRPELLHGTCLVYFTVIKVLWKEPRFIIIIIIIIVVDHLHMQCMCSCWFLMIIISISCTYWTILKEESVAALLMVCPVSCVAFLTSHLARSNCHYRIPTVCLWKVCIFPVIFCVILEEVRKQTCIMVNRSVL